MSNSTDNQTIITINSYQKVWGYEKMLYQITDNITLPVPVVEADFKYFFLCLVIMVGCKVIFRFPVPSLSTGLVIFVCIPAAATAILRYKTFDGKNPIVFLFDYLRFLPTRHQESECFIRVAAEPEHRALWRLGFRHRLRLSKGR